MEDTNETRLRLLEEQNKNMDLQIKRFTSHLESEQRVSVNQGKLIDSNSRAIEVQQKLIEKHNEMLFNTGKGILFEIDRMKERLVNKKYNWSLVFSVLALLISALGQIIKLIKG